MRQPGQRPFVEGFVRIVAPRGAFDLLLRGFLLLLMIGAMNWARDYAANGQSNDGFFNNLLESTIGVPFIVAALFLIGHLDRLQKDLAHLAATDLLTGLPNRRAFFESADTPDATFVCMIDIDHFKSINDRYGHHVGDLCLRAAADRLRMLGDAGHSAARIGGEEFALVLNNVAGAQAIEIAEALAGNMSVAVDGAPAPVRFTCSIGAASRPQAPSFDEALRRADEALYRAKDAGRARLCVWSPAIRHAERHPLARRATGHG